MSELRFEQIKTGRTHQVNGVYEPILGADGEPESEWALFAVVEGHRVVLDTFNNGYVEHMVSRPDTELDDDASASSTPAASDEGQSELDAANARIAELEAQLAAAGNTTEQTPPTPPAAPEQTPAAGNNTTEPTPPTPPGQAGDNPPQ